MTEATVLMVSNTDEVISGIQAALASTVYSIDIARDAASGESFLTASRPEIVLVELDVKRSDGGPFYAKIHEYSPSSKIILLCNFEDIKLASALVNRNAAHDYFVVRPLYDSYRLPIMIRRALESGDPSSKGLAAQPSALKRQKKATSVLVIEDNEATMDLIEDILTCMGYEVLKAYTAVKGMEIAREGLPDLILLDIMLPGMSGIEALQRLKRNLLTAEVPVIMMTSLSEKTIVDQCIKEQCDDYIVKPFSKEMLEDRVRRQIAGAGKKPTGL